MEIKIFESLPEEAKAIGQKVFTGEQGFTAEFADKDKIAVHLVAFDENATPIATCRIFKEDGVDFYVLGRLAVVKEYRGKKVGAYLISEAERYVKENGGRGIVLLAQQRVVDFYKKAGFTEFGGVDNYEGCPHVRMKKFI